MASKDQDRYAIRSRCALCRDFVIEGREHTCPRTGKTTTHENPNAPKPEDRRSGSE